jgi:hypothetical protein
MPRPIEAFEDVLDLRQHLFVSHDLVDVHHHSLLEVRYGLQGGQRA